MLNILFVYITQNSKTINIFFDTLRYHITSNLNVSERYQYLISAVLCMNGYLHNLSAERATVAQRSRFHNNRRALWSNNARRAL